MSTAYKISLILGTLFTLTAVLLCIRAYMLHRETDAMPQNGASEDRIIADMQPAARNVANANSQPEKIDEQFADLFRRKEHES